MTDVKLHQAVDLAVGKGPAGHEHGLTLALVDALIAIGKDHPEAAEAHLEVALAMVRLWVNQRKMFR